MGNVCNEERFLSDVAQHQMIIIHDDGVNRHIRFKAPDTMIEYFDLITWSGHLCYTGDMGTYVFRRLEDMFQFFRTDNNDFNFNKNGLSINLGYWSEKLEAVDRSGNGGSYKQFSEEKFTRAVMEYLIQWIRSNAYRTTKDERRDLWDSVIGDVIEADGDSGGYRKQVAANDFSHRVNLEVGQFYFQDFFEYDVTEYTHHFVWCCYALAWGIQQYDNFKKESSC